jgi:hypothetical protein
MFSDSDFPLTADESTLLIVAAKLLDITKEHSIRPPKSERDVEYWNAKVREELVRPHRSPSFCMHMSLIMLPFSVSLMLSMTNIQKA